MFELFFRPKFFFKRTLSRNGKLNLIYLFVPLFMIYLSPFGCGDRGSFRVIGPIEMNLLILVLYLLYFLYSVGLYRLTIARSIGWRYLTAFPATFLPFILLSISLTLLDLGFHLSSLIVTTVAIIWSFFLETLLMKELMKKYSIVYHILVRILRDFPLILLIHGGILRG